MPGTAGHIITRADKQEFRFPKLRNRPRLRPPSGVTTGSPRRCRRPREASMSSAPEEGPQDSGALGGMKSCADGINARGQAAG
jgi:hypothetical protein